MNTDANHALPRLESDMAIRDRIFTIRDVQVILDRDLAELYGEKRGVSSPRTLASAYRNCKA